MGLKTDFTKAQADTFIEYLESDNRTVRIVDPVSQKVTDTSGTVVGTEICHTIWGRCNRCENCTSLQALEKHNCAYKIEFIDKRTYWVMSRYMRIDGRECIMEVVTDATDTLVMGTDQIDTVGKLIHSYNKQLVTDPLTGLYNRRFLDDYFIPSLKCCHEQNITVNVAIMDLDDFKNVNDQYGHLAGDALLKDVAGFWHRKFNDREKNHERIVVRFGGDEAIVIACGMSPEAFVNEIHTSYSELRKVCYVSDRLCIPFSISIGIASSTELESDWAWDDLLGKADGRLYEGKSERDRS